uniref:Uncharacterized protein n=1 Tax=Ralstonia solanacearum TaxID=305 RepID=A0A0S4U1K1_RALSL|nr:conserved protein of unknown function [Ralstonia solanacearum]
MTARVLGKKFLVVHRLDLNFSSTITPWVE